MIYYIKDFKVEGVVAQGQKIRRGHPTHFSSFTSVSAPSQADTNTGTGVLGLAHKNSKVHIFSQTYLQ